MRFYQVDPMHDARWAELADRHPGASVFHSVPWLKALQHTYGYEPVAFTTSSPTAELKNGLVFCHVKSMLTGNRLVSLPFSDHCEPLFNSGEDVNLFAQYLKTISEREHWQYVEVRPVNVNFGQADTGVRFVPSATYFLHILDLRPDLGTVFRNLDKDSVQRRVQRAQQAGLTEKCGTSDNLLKEFYRLLVITRRRHQVPPPPFAWFRNLIHFQGEALEIRLAYESETPIAAVLTLRFKDTVYYKYGCSDARFNKFGAMPWLLWNAIAAAKSSGATEFDLGRTEDDNAGLLAFKNHWVPHPKQLVYWRFPESSNSVASVNSWKMKVAQRIFALMPTGLLAITGRLLYRHLG
jgi:lipid II:glycine glycyltransferase (peptidoglycan interpeptide bridge formation enzyme)